MEPTFDPISVRTLSLWSNSNLLKLLVKFCYYINILCLHGQKQGSRNSDMNTLGFYSGSQAIVHLYSACTLWNNDLLVQLQSTGILACDGHWLLSLMFWISCYSGWIRFDCDFFNEGVSKDLIMKVMCWLKNEKIVEQVQRCITDKQSVLHSYSTTNKMHLFLKLFILVKRSTCFGRSFCPSSGA